MLSQWGDGEDRVCGKENGLTSRRSHLCLRNSCVSFIQFSMGLVGRGIYKKKKGWLQKTKTLGPLPPKLKVKQVPQMRNSPNVYIRPSKDHLDLAFTRDEQVFFQTKPNAEMPTAWYFDPKLLR